jgi:hypothetical protein
MKKRLLFAVFVAFLLSLCSTAQAQQLLSTSFTENLALAPATVTVGQNFSTTTATGASFSLTGGAIAAGSYRISVTCNSLTGTETPQSVDTAATSVVTTTGATSTLTIYPPICVGTGNEIGWRMGVSGNGGATATETLQTITSSICTLSTSTTTSCSLNSPAVFTASTNFTNASGIGPATPGTLIFPPTANQANMALFENSLYRTRTVYWTITGTVPSACTFNVQTGATIAALASVGQTITCTTSGSYQVPYTTLINFVAINLATYTAGDTTTITTFTMVDSPVLTPIYWGPAAPTSACAAPMGVFFLTGANSNMYTCVTTTWTAITLP